MARSTLKPVIDRLKSARQHVFLNMFGGRLSLSQQAILAAEKLEPGVACYAMMRAWDFSGPLDEAAFARALVRLTRRHDALRMTVTWHRNDYVAWFHKQSLQPLGKIEISGGNPGGVQAEIDRQVSRISLRPIPAIDNPLWDAWILTVSPGRSVVCFRLHHLIGDDWSLALIERDLFALYAEEIGGDAANLPTSALFKTYLANLAKDTHAVLPAAKAPPPPDLLLPQTINDEGQGDAVANRSVRAFTGAKSSALEAVARSASLTPFAVISAAFNLVISHMSDQPNAVLSLSVSRRNCVERENTLGCLTDVLNLSMHRNKAQSFVEFASTVTRGVRAFQQHRARELAQNTVTFSYYNAPDFTRISPLVQATQRDIKTRALFSHLHLGVHKSGAGFEFVLEGRRGSFKPEHLERIADCLVLILEQVLENPRIGLGDIRLASPEEEVLLAGLSVNLPAEPCPLDIPARFGQMVAQHPGEPALLSPEKSWTYAELDRASHKMAHWLRHADLPEGTIVGVALPRGATLLITTLAALRAGLVVVPLDLEYPATRLRDLCASASLGAILGTESMCAELRQEARLICVPDPDELADISDDQPLDLTSNDPDRAAYIVFTSGTTGQPKGIPTSHRAVLRLTVGSELCPAGPGDRFVQISSTGFDASFGEIWGALLNGAELVVTHENLLTQSDFSARFRALGPTLALLTARLLDVIADTDPRALSSLRYLLVGGEVASPAHLRKVMQANPELRIFNCYGPVENTGISTYYPINHAPPGPLPIGRPQSGVMAFVLSDTLLPLPVGFAGELCVGGPGLAAGYLDRDAETAQKFVSVPAYTLGLEQSGDVALYRTGDRARWNDDLQLEYLGRKDGQFKVNGYRLESAEIEVALLGLEGVSGAVVEPDFRPGEQMPSGIIAFVSRQGDAPDETAIRRRLAAHLPRPALPTRYLFVDAIPKNQNGKADRARLRDLAAKARHAASKSAPSPDRLVGIWEGLLGRAVPSEDASFFDLGGASLSVVRMVAQVERAYDCSLDLTEVLGDARLKTLRALIQTAQEAAPPFTRHLVRLKAGHKRETPVVFLHAMYGGLAWSNDMIKGWRAPNPLFGLTFIRREDDDWRPRDFDALIAEFVEDLAKVFKERAFHIIGYSSGGQMALALYNAARLAGLNARELFVIDTDLRLMEYDPKPVPPGTSVKNSVARVMAPARSDVVNQDIHYFASTLAFEFPNKRRVDDWAFVTEKRLLIYNIETCHEGIVYEPCAAEISDKIGEILRGQARADRTVGGCSNRDILNLRSAVLRAAIAGNPDAAIDLLQEGMPATCAPNDWPDWFLMSMLRLQQVAGCSGAAKPEVTRAARGSTNPATLNELVRNSPNMSARIDNLGRLVAATDTQMLGAIRLCAWLCRMGDVAGARTLVERVLANEDIAPAGLFAQAVVAGHEGDQKTLRAAMEGALGREGLTLNQLIWALDFLKEAGETLLVKQALKLGRKKFPDEY